MKADQNADVLARLIQGKSVDNCGLGAINNRIDLRGLVVPEPRVAKQLATKIADVAVLSGMTKFHEICLDSLDFTGSCLNNILFFNCKINNCVFEKCLCQNWKLWGTTVSNASFRLADLRNSALGGVQNDRTNTYQKVDFTEADLRQTKYISARFNGCLFKETQLNKVDFHGSTFVDCSFEGELREVCFNRKAFKMDMLPRNEMLRVDFSHAQLRSVEFRGLDLENVRFPTNDDHILLDDYPQMLDELLKSLRGQTDVAVRKLAAYLGVYRKWVGPKQRRGVLNKNDLIEIGGEKGLLRVLEIIKLNSTRQP